MKECKHVQLSGPTARQLVAQERFRCTTCGILVKKVSGLSPGENRVTQCSRGHSVTYHRPATYYMQAEPDPLTGIEGNDANSGLSPMEPLLTFAEAFRRCEPHDSVIIPAGACEIKD